ncbi:MAG: hypothetical protein HY814_03250 [Candidatus Riflebacteria bacterium]|nr:hypothetical protein [Candidatus Riflebacteria bacterium]
MRAPARGRLSAPCAGFSLIELLLTLMLGLLLVGLLAWHYAPLKGDRQTAVALEELHRVRDGVEAYRLTTHGVGPLPSSPAAVPALAGPDWLDPWGQPYGIDTTGSVVFSLGADGLRGTPDDLTARLSQPRQRRLVQPPGK